MKFLTKPYFSGSLKTLPVLIIYIFFKNCTQFSDNFHGIFKIAFSSESSCNFLKTSIFYIILPSFSDGFLTITSELHSIINFLIKFHQKCERKSVNMNFLIHIFIETFPNKLKTLFNLKSIFMTNSLLNLSKFLNVSKYLIKF